MTERLTYKHSYCNKSILKKDMVRRRYSNDDQIAIMLNSDLEALSKMQEWRDWSG